MYNSWNSDVLDLHMQSASCFATVFSKNNPRKRKEHSSEGSQSPSISDQVSTATDPYAPHKRIRLSERQVKYRALPGNATGDSGIALHTDGHATSAIDPGLLDPALFIAPFDHDTISQAYVIPSPTSSRTTAPVAPPPVSTTTASSTLATIPAQQPSAVDPVASYMVRHPNRATTHISGKGNRGVALSEAMIRAMVEIEGKSFDDLPSRANSPFYHEMRSSATPKTVDPTLINCVTTAQEILTVCQPRVYDHQNEKG